jgi:hypothetical protein
MFLALLGSIATWFLKRQIGHDKWAEFLQSYFAFIYGIPAASTAAFGIVVFFGITTPGTLELSVWGLQVKGPAGSSLMFVIVFLAFILAIKILRPR